MADNNNKNKVNVNSKGIQFYDSEGERFKSTLTFALWNENLSLSINPALPQDKRNVNGKGIFDYDTTVKANLGPNKVSALIKLIEEDIIPNIGKVDVTRAIRAGATGLVCVGTGYSDANPDGQPYIIVCKELDKETKKPVIMQGYEFNLEELINDYNYETGTYVREIDKTSEIRFFVDLMKQLHLELTALSNHGRRINEYYAEEFRRTLFGKLAERCGMEFKKKEYSNRRNDDFFKDDNSSSSSSDDIAEISQTKSLDDIPF